MQNSFELNVPEGLDVSVPLRRVLIFCDSALVVEQVGGLWKVNKPRKLGHVDNIEWLTSAVAYLSNPPAQLLFKERDSGTKRRETTKR